MFTSNLLCGILISCSKNVKHDTICLRGVVPPPVAQPTRGIKLDDIILVVGVIPSHGGYCANYKDRGPTLGHTSQWNDMNPCDVIPKRSFVEENSRKWRILQFFQYLQAWRSSIWHDSFTIDLRCRKTVGWAWQFVDMENQNCPEQGPGFLGGPTLGRFSVLCFGKRCKKCCVSSLDWFGRRICQSILEKNKLLSMGFPVLIKGLTLHFYNMDG